MSQRNVEIVRRVIEAGASGDFPLLFSLHDPEWVGFIPEEYPLGGTYRGLDGLRAFVEDWLEVWEEFRVEPEEFVDAGDAVVVVVRYWGRGKGSGVEVRDQWTYFYKLRHGKIIRWRVYASRDEAIEAAGRPE